MPLGKRQRNLNKQGAGKVTERSLNKYIRHLKRIGDLHDKICTVANIDLADAKARQKKSHRWGIVKHDKKKEKENLKLKETLEEGTYKTSKYSTFKIYEPKERIIFRLPYYPDRITHHAIMNVMEPIWVKLFVKNTYSCIKDRGIHNLAQDLRKDLDGYPEETMYCLKMDVRKFYPSVTHEILEDIIKKKIKDKKLLDLLHEIVESADGVPIGNYLSQFFANLYLCYFDHWAKEELGLKFYYRYADDIVILHHDKNFLHNVLVAIKVYLRHVVNLELKPNYQIYPVDSRGIDFVGYKFFHTHTLLRHSIKQRMFRLIQRYTDGKMGREELKRRLVSYFGWLKYCDSKNLLTKIQKMTGIRFSNWNGKKVNISKFYHKYIHIVDVVNYSKFFRVDFTYNHESYSFYSKSKYLHYSLMRYNRFPLNFKIRPYVRSKKNRDQCSAPSDRISE